MFRHWFLAIRPKTLIASVLPVTGGTILAYRKTDEISLSVAILCLLYCLLVQVGTNLGNDYFDYMKGADKNRKLGPERMVSSGKIKPQHVLNATIFSLFLSFILGLKILAMIDGGYMLIIIGLLSVACAILYTGGPFPLAYNGFGDVFVILFFGLVAVETTHFVLCESANVVWDTNYALSFGIGLLINNLLIVNNYRDYEEDFRVQKKTTIVLFGKTFGLIFFFFAILITFILIPVLEPIAWATTFLLPIGLYFGFKLRKAMTVKDYGFVLAGCATLVALETICLVFGFFFISI